MASIQWCVLWSIYLYRCWPTRVSTYSTLQADVEEWVSTHTIAHMPELTGGNWGAVTALGKPVVCAVVNPNQPEHKAYASVRSYVIRHLIMTIDSWKRSRKLLRLIWTGLPLGGLKGPSSFHLFLTMAYLKTVGPAFSL